MATATEQLRVLYPWLPEEVFEAYDVAFSNGDVSPWATIRTDSRYEEWFPGNLTEDGSVRYAEGQYAAVRESYRDIMRGMGITNTDLFEDRFTELMKGEVSPAEFEARATELYDRVVSASDAIQEAFAAANGFETTLEGILAAAFDPDIGDKLLSREITMAEITGAGTESGFNLSRQRVEEFEQYGVTLDQARALYQDANTQLPVLDILAKRHLDPDDTFDLNEFEDLAVFKDPFQNRRMRRLISQERSTFSTGPSARSTRGALTGLVQE